MSLVRSALALTGRGTRNFSRSTVVKSSTDKVHPGYKNLAPKQEHFSLEDGTPIFLKGGVVDRIMYKLTMALCVGAVIWDFKVYYDFAQK